MEWTRVIFSDENKLNLDGPDGFNSYWGDLKKESRYNSKCNFCDGNVIVFACFSSYGRSEFTFINHRMDLLVYQNVLRDNLIPYFKRFRSVLFKYMQDNAICHASAKTKKWISDKKNQSYRSSIKKPRFKSNRKIKWILIRAIYKDNGKYSTVQELKDAIFKGWDEIPTEKLVSFANSMPKRTFELKSKNRGIQTIKNSFKSLNLNMCYNFAPQN
uniref:DDE_3 domain-containing protein n=1 Tax=Strongyloides venezuelensis TaxID=75913 RepID=A0A0K0FMA1_STRVS